MFGFGSNVGNLGWGKQVLSEVLKGVYLTYEALHTETKHGAMLIGIKDGMRF